MAETICTEMEIRELRYFIAVKSLWKVVKEYVDVPHGDKTPSEDKAEDEAANCANEKDLTNFASILPNWFYEYANEFADCPRQKIRRRKCCRDKCKYYEYEGHLRIMADIRSAFENCSSGSHRCGGLDIIFSRRSVKDSSRGVN